jgi:hypothetical protein
MVQHIGHSRRRSEPNSPELIAQIEALQAELAAFKNEYKPDMKTVALDMAKIDEKATPPVA